MDTLIMAGQLILSLSILITLHELGHFLAARAFGIKVEKFYLFFDAWGFKLISFTYKGCEYGIGWLPLGGYVKIAGMIDESMDTEQMASEPKIWEFRSKAAWKRMIVMLAGIIVNIIVGVFIFWMLTFSSQKNAVAGNNTLTHKSTSHLFIQSLPVGASKTWDIFSANAKGLGQVFTGEINASQAFKGPIGIATLFGNSVNWFKFWTLTGVLSIALALMNLLPIPALDGGHAVFLLIEMIKGSPLSIKFMERAQLAGFVILLGLMVFTFGNDIIQLL